MKYRPLGRTGWNVSEISFGAWAIGGFWGSVSDDESLAALNRAIDQGVNLIDTADVYGDGRSERLIGQLKKQRKEEIIVATKAGRRLPNQTVEGYSGANLARWIEDSLRNLGVEFLDLLQLHCPSTDLYDDAEVFGILDDLVRAGKIRYYGVSVEKIEEALKALEYPNVQSGRLFSTVFDSVLLKNSSPVQKRRKSVSSRVCLLPVAC
jgi:aryl-alcohol dehydrogenase-like predicted oxidoreductase